jgi:hypothetical protein
MRSLLKTVEGLVEMTEVGRLTRSNKPKWLTHKDITLKMTIQSLTEFCWVQTRPWPA